MGLAQVELALDPAPCPVLELTTDKEFVDVLAFGIDQQQFDFIVKSAVFSIGIVATALTVEMPEPVLVMVAQRSNHVFRNTAQAHTTFSNFTAAVSLRGAYLTGTAAVAFRDSAPPTNGEVR
jgi:hypothetical protein